MINIRKYQQGDESALRQLFYNTIRHVNTRDYTEEQVKAWAPDDYDKSAWAIKIQKINPFVATIDEEIVGYADIQDDGYVDHFFCHADYQGKGIGKTLMNKIFAAGKAKGVPRFYAHASITARPFFEHFGFRVIKEQQVEIRGQVLTNFVVEKQPA